MPKTVQHEIEIEFGFTIEEETEASETELLDNPEYTHLLDLARELNLQI